MNQNEKPSKYLHWDAETHRVVFEERRKELVKEYLGDPTIQLDGTVRAIEHTALEDEIPITKSIGRFTDSEGRTFYSFLTPEIVSSKERTELRDRIFEQQEALEALPPERRNLIESDYASGRRRFGTWLAVRKYRDCLQSQELERTFKQAQGPK